MSDCSTRAWDVPMSNRYTHRFGDAQWHEPKKYDEFPGMKRIERIVFTDETMLDVDYPFVAADREIERVEIDGVSYVDGERMLKANGVMCAEIKQHEDEIKQLKTENIELRNLVADMRREMKPVESDVFLLGYIDGRIADLRIEVDE